MIDGLHQKHDTLGVDPESIVKGLYEQQKDAALRELRNRKRDDLYERTEDDESDKSEEQPVFVPDLSQMSMMRIKSNMNKQLLDFRDDAKISMFLRGQSTTEPADKQDRREQKLQKLRDERDKQTRIADRFISYQSLIQKSTRVNAKTVSPTGRHTQNVSGLS